MEKSSIFLFSLHLKFKMLRLTSLSIGNIAIGHLGWILLARESFVLCGHGNIVQRLVSRGRGVTVSRSTSQTSN